jgi:hypothetical protein
VPDEDGVFDAVPQLGLEPLTVLDPRARLVDSDLGSDDLVAAVREQGSDLVPDPGTVPASVNQREASQGTILRSGGRGSADGVEPARLVEALELVQAAVLELDA